MAEGFAGNAQIRRAFFGTAGGENGTCFDVPSAVALDQNETFVRGDGSDAADECRNFVLGLFFGFIGFVRLEQSACSNC